MKTLKLSQAGGLLPSQSKPVTYTDQTANFALHRSVHLDLTNDEDATEEEIVQSVVAESLLQCSRVAPPYNPLTPQNE